MRLETDALVLIENVTAAQLEEVLAEGAFCVFLVLIDGDGFIQTRPFEALEYRDATSGRLFRIDDPDWETMRMALFSYLAGGPDWRNLVWEEFWL